MLYSEWSIYEGLRYGASHLMCQSAGRGAGLRGEIDDWISSQGGISVMDREITARLAHIVYLHLSD